MFQNKHTIKHINRHVADNLLILLMYVISILTLESVASELSSSLLVESENENSKSYRTIINY